MAVQTQSLKFVAASNQQLAMTDANFGAYDLAKFAIFGKVKRASTNAAGSMQIMCQQSAIAGDNSFILRFINDRLDFLTSTDGASIHGRLLTSATFTSTSDWLKFLVWYDSANATAGDRMRMWTGLNGNVMTEQTSFTTDTNPTSSARNSVSAMRIGGDGPSTADFDGLIYQLGFFSGSLPTVSDVEDNGVTKDISSLTGLWSLLDVAGGSVISDAVLTTDWSNTNTVTADVMPGFCIGTANSTGAGSAVGKSLKKTAGSCAGIATVAGVGGSKASAVASSSGIATSIAVGVARSARAGTSQGIANALAASKAVVKVAGTISGSATATSIGALYKKAMAQANGTALALGTSFILELPQNTFALKAANDSTISLQASLLT